MSVVRRISCTVQRIIEHGERVYTVELDPSTRVPSFKPGQFLHLAIDAFDGASFWPDSRVFSIASSSRERDRLEITYAVKGSFTTRMERELHRGSVVWVKLPFGDFVVDETTDAVLFAGGTGATAFAGFLRSLTPDLRARVLLLYGARTPDLFVYGSLAEECARKISTVTCHLVDEQSQGRLAVAPAWPDITALLNPIFYLSGPPLMLSALTSQLRDREVPPERIRTDAWK